MILKVLNKSPSSNYYFPMSFFADNLKAHLEARGLNVYRVDKLWKDFPLDKKLHIQYMYSLFRGEEEPKIETMEKLLNIPGAELSMALLKGWRAVDVYGPEAIYEAFKSLEGDQAEELRREIDAAKAELKKEKAKK